MGTLTIIHSSYHSIKNILHKKKLTLFINNILHLDYLLTRQFALWESSDTIRNTNAIILALWKMIINIIIITDIITFFFFGGMGGRERRQKAP